MANTLLAAVMMVISMVCASAADFQAFKAGFHKVYATPAAERKARAAFQSNVKFIIQHNAEYHAGLHSYEVGVNEFADLSLEDFASQYLSPMPDSMKNSGAETFLPATNVSEIDWRNASNGLSYVTHVKNQKSCGSCWAFSAVGSTESAWAIAGHNLTSLSEMQLVDCDKKDHGCSGGVMNNAFKYIHTNGGLTTEANYGYKPKRGACNTTKEKETAASITGFTNVPKKNLVSGLRAHTTEPQDSYI